MSEVPLIQHAGVPGRDRGEMHPRVRLDTVNKCRGWSEMHIWDGTASRMHMGCAPRVSLTSVMNQRMNAPVEHAGVSGRGRGGVHRGRDRYRQSMYWMGRNARMNAPTGVPRS